MVCRTITQTPDADPRLRSHPRKNRSGGTAQVIRSDRNNSPRSIDPDRADLCRYGLSYPKTRSESKTQKMISTNNSVTGS